MSNTIRIKRPRTIMAASLMVNRMRFAFPDAEHGRVKLSHKSKCPCGSREFFWFCHRRKKPKELVGKNGNRRKRRMVEL